MRGTNLTVEKVKVDGRRRLNNPLTTTRHENGGEQELFEFQCKTRRPVITSFISLFHSPVQLWGFRVGLLVIGNVAPSWSSQGGNTQGDEAGIVEGSNEGPLDDSDVEAECERRFNRSRLYESGWERNGECEEPERDSRSASASRSIGFDVAAFAFGGAGVKQIGDPGVLQPELVKSSSLKLS